jgi:hypothetical protein
MMPDATIERLFAILEGIKEAPVRGKKRVVGPPALLLPVPPDTHLLSKIEQKSDHGRAMLVSWTNALIHS